MHPLICFPHRGIQIPFAIPTNSPWPLSLSGPHFPLVSLTLPADHSKSSSAPGQKLHRCGESWHWELLTAPSSCPSRMVVVSLGDQRQKKGGGVKKRKERLKAEKEGRQNKPLKSERKCMSEISIRKHSRGQRGGSWENKNKRAKCAGVGGGW